MLSVNKNDTEKTWTAGVTQFFDMTQDEFREKVLGGLVGDVPAACTNPNAPNMRKKPADPLPDS